MLDTQALRILIIGGGAWGTAMALAAARHPAGHAVSLWLRDAAQAAQLREQGSNERYLPGIALPPALRVASGEQALQAEVAQAQLVILGTPVAAMQAMLGQLAPCLRADTPLVWLCKGFAPTPQQAWHGQLPHELQQRILPQALCGALSGPSFAQEVARGQPTALVAASPHQAVRQTLMQAFHAHALRLYSNDDLVGVEVGGAVKNVLAIATGICDGLELGLNARAALITRGLAEMTRLGVAMGARAATFTGLSGMGDLVLTATGNLSRNRKVGLLLAQGQRLPDILTTLGHVAEGVHCAQAVVARAAQLGVHMPISEAVVRLLDGQEQAAHAVQSLLRRDPAAEAGHEDITP